MAERRRICFLTATRAEFGKLKPLMHAVQDEPGLQLRIFATGMHTLARYGRTVKEIRRAGFPEPHVFINQDSTVTTQMDLVLAATIQGIGHYLREFRPDLLVLHGDRIEAMAGAIAGALNDVRTAHVEGGERSGTVDDLLRHAVSKLCHAHFVANDEAAQRLRQMGEDEAGIFVIGSPDIDVMCSDALPSLDEVRRRYEIPFDRYAIALLHPVTTELARMPAVAHAFVDALLAAERNFVVVDPNNDLGSEPIRDALARLDGHPRFRRLPSLRFEYFLSLLRGGDFMIGNSSAGIREAPVFGRPAINIGSRQQGRSVADGVVSVDDSREAMLAAMRAVPASIPVSRLYGDGRSAEHFLEVVRSPAFWSLPLQKPFRDRAFA